MNIAVVIPCYNCADHIAQVIKTLPSLVTNIYVVDDACPQGSGKAAKKVSNKRLKVINHKKNQGVGGAVLTGYRQALADGADIIVKMDGDGQMDPAQLPALIAPLQNGAADYAKGNRFQDFQALRSMPKQRLVLNSLLSFMVKLSSGYWRLLDPANGYTAITRQALESLNQDKLARRYAFESDMLLQLSLQDARVADIPMPARYGEEVSQLKFWRTGPGLLFTLLRGWFKRLIWQYLITDFNMGSLYFLAGLPLLLGGVSYGAIQWQISIATNVERSTGTVVLIALLIILGFQLLLQAMAVDMQRGEKLAVKPQK